ncbi:trypsin-like peptidase domain-containing protein [Pokkaliibacter sp. CJK22405]|uniref:trypsin-like peptidase domain-containing protein n=1 Tax=Pokkaliibacter sp. CJK22405 TaxID=3384615 RepID=UPI003984E532
MKTSWLSTCRSFLWPAITGVAVGAALLAWHRPTEAPTQAPAVSAIPAQGPASYADAVEQAAPAVVNIYTRTYQKVPVHPLLNDPLFRRFFNLPDSPTRDRIQSSLGSGVIIDSKGYVVTNHHVINNADEIKVALRDGREADAKVIGSDQDADLALLKIDLPNLPVIKTTDDSTARIGDVVLAIGNPFGVGQTVTMGIISAKGRAQLGLSAFERFIQTDAAINPGNSGGALVDTQGRLLGINTAIFSKSGGYQGIGFAIPANMVNQVVKDLVQYGEVIRGWLGVETQELKTQSKDNASSDALLVTSLYQDGPAEQAGLRVGDIITRIDNKAVMGNNYSLYQISQMKPDTKVMLHILRGQNETDIQVKVGKRPASLR